MQSMHSEQGNAEQMPAWSPEWLLELASQQVDFTE